jgi:hypothetical protein
LEIKDKYGNKIKRCFGNHDNTTVYEVGKITYPDSYDNSIFKECTNGIHFFITRKEAEDY